MKFLIFLGLMGGLVMAQDRLTAVKDVVPKGEDHWYSCQMDADCILIKPSECVMKFKFIAINKNFEKMYSQKFRSPSCKKSGVQNEGDVQAKCQEHECAVLFKGQIFSGKSMF